MHLFKRTWCEIDLSALQHNITQISNIAKKPLMAVVKANAYGHGDKQIARTCQRCGIQYFGVSNLNEALMLRKYGIVGEILILGYTPVDYVSQLVKHHISQTVLSVEYATALSQATNKPVRVHLKLDTGMHRIGLNVAESIPTEDLSAITSLPNLEIAGVFSHFACSDSFEKDDVAYTQKQQAQFFAGVEALHQLNIYPEVVHLQNSAGILNYSEISGTIARAGIVLYGLNPSDDVLPLETPLKPVMSIKTVVQQVKQVPQGSFLSYGRTYQSEDTVTVATLPVGYADGYPRALSNCGDVLIQGKRCRILGRVCMDQMMVDVTGLQVNMGDTAILMGRDGDEQITAEELASHCGTIHYEFVCGIGRRVPRAYLQDGEVIDVIDDSLHLS